MTINYEKTNQLLDLKQEVSDLREQVNSLQADNEFLAMQIANIYENTGILAVEYDLDS